jgi:hypothetical protein
MQVGSFKQKANPYLVGFVFSCICVVIFLLHVKVKAEEKAEQLSYNGDWSAYLNN